MLAEPSAKSTLPVGLSPETVAVSVTADPTAAGLPDVETTIVLEYGGSGSAASAGPDPKMSRIGRRFAYSRCAAPSLPYAAAKSVRKDSKRACASRIVLSTLR